MKLKYYFTILMAIFLPLTFVACDSAAKDKETEKVDPNDEPDPDPVVDPDDNKDPEDGKVNDMLVFSEESVSYNDFSLKVDNSAAIPLYIIETIKISTFKEKLGSDLNAAAAYVLKDRFGTGVDLVDYADGVGMEPEGKYPLPIFDAQNIMIYKASDYKGILVNTDYIVVGFGVTNSGLINTEVVSYEISTTEMTDDDMVDVSFDISAVSDFSNSNFIVDVKPSKADVNYIVGAFDYSEFAVAGLHCDSNGNPEWEEAAEEWSADLSMWYPEGSDSADYVDFTVADGIAVFSGDATVDMAITYGTATIKPDYKYVVIAFAVDAYGLRISEVSHAECTTAAPEIEKGVSFAISEVEAAVDHKDGYGYSGKLKITPSDPSMSYAYSFAFDNNPYDSFGIADMSDQEIFTNCNFGMIGVLTPATGEVEYSYSMIFETTTFVVFGYESGSMTTEMTRYVLEIPAQ